MIQRFVFSSAFSAAMVLLSGNAPAQVAPAQVDRAQVDRAQVDRAQVDLDVRPGATLINDVVATHPLARFVESSSAVAVEINLNKIDRNGFSEFTAKIAGENNPISQLVKDAVPQLIDAGIDKVFLLGSTQIPNDQGPLIVFAPKDTAKALVLVKKALPMVQARIDAGTIILGSPQLLARMAQRTAANRPPTSNEQLQKLLGPLAGAGKSHHTAVVYLPKNAKDALTKFWPERTAKGFPVQFSPRQLAEDVGRVVINFQLPPETSAEGRIETGNEKAAKRVAEIVRQAISAAGPLASGVDLSVEQASVKVVAGEALTKSFITAFSDAQKSANRAVRMNSLKQIGLAIHNYAAKNKHLPPRCYVDREGMPLHSWRTALLPFIEQQALHNAMDLAKSWDAQPNSAIINTIPSTYVASPPNAAKTTFRAPVLKGSLWHGNGPPRTFRDVVDGTASTIVVIEAPANASTHWADPAPWIIDENKIVEQIFGDRDEILALMLDGSVRAFTKAELPAEKLKAWLTIAGREVIH